MIVWQCPNPNCGHLLSDIDYKLVKIDHQCPGCKESKLHQFFSKEEKIKYYCWNCKEVEIPEPQICCSGTDCGCLGLPIDPPFCSEECQKEYYKVKLINGN